MKIEQDLHVHTYLSKCAQKSATPDACIENAVKLGLNTIGITDHLWDHENLPYNVYGDEYSDRTKDWGNSFYTVQNTSYVCSIRDEFEKIDKKGVRVLYGCECEYDYIRHRPAITKETAKKFDLIIVPNSHTHLTMPHAFYHPYEKHIEFMVDAFYDIVNSDVAEYITAIAHPFMAVCCYYDKDILMNMITDEQFYGCFKAAKEKNIAIEINTFGYPGKTDDELKNLPELRMYKIAKDTGCKFTFGTDTHTGTAQIAAFPYAEKIADILKLTKKDILVL